MNYFVKKLVNTSNFTNGSENCFPAEIDLCTLLYNMYTVEHGCR